MKKILLGVCVVALLALAAGGYYAYRLISIPLPDYPPPSKTVWLEQNWSDKQRIWFHHTTQGTHTFPMPYAWFLALERPYLSLTGPGKLSDADYLNRFGFIANLPGDPADLPVGFAKQAPAPNPTTGKLWSNPATGEEMATIGLTCAACHSGQMTYRGTAIHVDGAPALSDLMKFQKAIGLSVAFTRYLPWRFSSFAEQVLGPGADSDAKDKLKAQMDGIVSLGKKLMALDQNVAAASTYEGFGRLDALNRIGNQVFAVDMGVDENYVATDAPVNFPHIWSTSWFDWVQYNGSIRQPMVRNAGEALGVRAIVNLSNAGQPTFNSTVAFQNLYDMERQLAGPPPTLQKRFDGLRAPRWPAGILAPIDQDLAAKGAELYQRHCQACHHPAPDTPAFWDDRYWEQSSENPNEKYLRVTMVDVNYVGTDPNHARGMQWRMVKVPPGLGIPQGGYGKALGRLVEKTVNYWYDTQAPPVSAADRQRMNGYRQNKVRAPAQYKARPLNGIWATAPYLHNGAVPTLYHLLSPVEERPAKFFLGNREFDPVRVGYITDPIAGGFELDTSLPGNSNHGHEFTDGPRGAGVIGPLLTESERKALVEFLKTI